MKHKLDRQYLQLLQDILDNGIKKEGRNGATYSVFGRHIRHDMRDGFPLLTTKKMYFKGIVTELEWFLRGRSDLRYLLQRGNKIWVGDAYKNYVTEMQKAKHGAWLSEDQFIEEILNDDEFSEKWGDLGRIYGKQWRELKIANHVVDGNDVYTEDGILTVDEYAERFNEFHVDQIQNMIDDLKNKPDSRRIMVNAWNPAELDDMTLPPCHYSFQVWTRELSHDERYKIFNERFKDRGTSHSFTEEDFDDKGIPKRGISLLWNQRSVDTPLGLPFNIASYALLLIMIANEVNMVPLELIGNLGDTHIYQNQIDGVKEQLQRQYHPLPTVKVTDGINSTYENIELIDYISEDKINFPLSN